MTTAKKEVLVRARLQKVSFKRKAHPWEEIPRIRREVFRSFPAQKEAELRRWFHFLRRKDIKCVSQITSHHTIRPVCFQGGVGYCTAEPVPTIYNDPAMALRFNTNTTKLKAPRSRSPSVEVERKCYKAVSKVSRVTSTTTNSEDDEFPYLEPPAEENGDEHNTADLFVHDLASAVKQAHNYSSVNCSVGKSLSRVT